MKNSGFTLVELSIVLVIIGLLIGGILVAQSMISTVRQQAFIRQIQQIDVAVRNYKTKYAKIPGEGVLNGGLNDGFNGTAYFKFEVASFWPDLNETEAISQKPFARDPYPIPGPFLLEDKSDTPYAPTAKTKAKAAIIVFTEGGAGSGGKEFYYITDISTIDGFGYINTPTGYAMPAEMAAAIDIKTDDGDPFNGAVKAVGSGGFGSAADYVCAPSGYDLASPGDTCNLMIEMLKDTNY